MGDPVTTGIGVSALGSVAGSEAGNALMGGSSSNSGGSTAYVNNAVNNINSLLGSALTTALGEDSSLTNQAISQQNSSLSSALNALGSGLNNATQAATTNINTGFNQSQALNSGIALAGYNALDSYEDSLGQARPAAGNAALAQSLYNNASLQGAQNSLMATNGSLTKPTAPTSPTAPAAANINTISPTQLMTYIQQNTQGGHYNGVGASDYGSGSPLVSNVLSQGGATLNSEVGQQIAQQLAQQQYTAAMQNYNAALPNYQSQLSAYNNNLANYNNYNSLFSQTSPQQLALAQAYNSGNMGTPTKI